MNDEYVLFQCTYVLLRPLHFYKRKWETSTLQIHDFEENFIFSMNCFINSTYMSNVGLFLSYCQLNPNSGGLLNVAWMGEVIVSPPPRSTKITMRPEKMCWIFWMFKMNLHDCRVEYSLKCHLMSFLRDFTTCLLSSVMLNQSYSLTIRKNIVMTMETCRSF